MFLHLYVILFTWGSLSGGSLSREISVQGVSVRETPLPPRTVKNGQNASYWNAFLSFLKQTLFYADNATNLRDQLQIVLYLPVLSLVLLLLIINNFVPCDMLKIVSQMRFFVHMNRYVGFL